MFKDRRERLGKDGRERLNAHFLDVIKDGTFLGCGFATPRVKLLACLHGTTEKKINRDE